jgi:hypothetical protein
MSEDCSIKTTGSSSKIDAVSRAYASTGLDGWTTFRPGLVERRDPRTSNYLVRLSGQSSWVNSSQLDSGGNRETAALEVPPCADAVVGDGARVARCHGAEGEALLPREIGVPAMWRSTRSPSWTPPEDEDLLDIVVGCTARAGIATLATNRAPPRHNAARPW